MRAAAQYSVKAFSSMAAPTAARTEANAPEANMAPPDCLPDFFASGPPTPRSWSNALLTLLGVLATFGLVGMSFADWIDAPVNTKVVLKLRCTNAPGCRVEGVFDSTGCAASAFAAKAMAGGSELEVSICASDEWGDGIRIGATLGAAVGASPIEFMSTDGQWAGLPRAPPVTDVSASGGKGSVVELSSTTMVKLDATEAQSYRAGPATAGQFQCPAGMTVPALVSSVFSHHCARATAQSSPFLLTSLFHLPSLIHLPSLTPYHLPTPCPEPARAVLPSPPRTRGDQADRNKGPHIHGSTGDVGRRIRPSVRADRHDHVLAQTRDLGLEPSVGGYRRHEGVTE